MDLRPTLTLRKGRGRKGKGPYVGVRFRNGRWVSEIRIPKTSTRIWLGSHQSADKAARAYDAALYCLKGTKGSFNFPNNKRPDLASRSVGSLSIDEIQCIAAEFSCLDESAATPESSPMSPLGATTPDSSPMLPLGADLSLEPPGLSDLQSTKEMDANKVNGESYVPAFVPEEPYIPTLAPEEDRYIETYIPTFAPEEPYIPTFAPEQIPIPTGILQLDEWFGLDGDWMGKFK